MRVAIERLAWPFTGGTMTVRPTVLRAGTSARKFAIDVAGLDAEQFLQRFQIKNLNTTGKFDGVLPLIFEGATGRIVGGVLEARAGGGLIQYIGEVGQASMGAAGRLAFDALRRLRYRTLTLRLDGDLDAEIVTTIDFTGSNEAPLTAGSPLPMRATGLPFKFGVTVRAPFRALLGTAASFSDARAVIRAAKPVE
jgi:translocation and assembly module TamB